MTNKYKRFYYLLSFAICLSLAIFFVLKALEDRIVFFYSPTEVYSKEINTSQLIRVGGIVLDNSIFYDDGGLEVSFVITDTKNTLKIRFKGILPDLFREGQGIVAEGTLGESKKLFYAKSVLAKHDENYMPPEVKKVIEN